MVVQVIAVLVLLQSYITKCTNLRKASTTPFEKQLWKNLQNSLFGKFLESSRKHMSVAFVRSPEVAKRHVGQSTFVAHREINSELCLMFHKPSRVKLDKLVAIGTTILDLSKGIKLHFLLCIIKL